jgi:hypothetical protein
MRIFDFSELTRGSIAANEPVSHEPEQRADNFPVEEEDLHSGSTAPLSCPDGTAITVPS